MTAQIPELLFFEDEPSPMHACPPLPDDPRIVEIDAEDLGEGADPLLSSSACWRGYRGTWKIKDGKLYLIELRGRYRLEGGPLLAVWVNRTLTVPRGELLTYVHAGFASIYEQEIHLRIENGIVSSTKVIDNRPWWSRLKFW